MLQILNVDAIQMGTYNICFYKVDKKYTGCILKTIELLDCALIGVCAVIRSNMVLFEENMPQSLHNTVAGIQSKEPC